jgi:hypothetical protein
MNPGPNANQGRPSPTAWSICDAVVYSIGGGLILWAILSAATF